MTKTITTPCELKKASFSLKLHIDGCITESKSKYPNPDVPKPPTPANVLRSLASQVALAAELCGFGDEIAEQVAETIQRERARKAA